jgi:hypothetical protein
MPSQQYRDQFVGEPGDVVEKYLREHNNIFEELSGPFWTIGQFDVYGSYTIVDCTLNVAKRNLKNLIADIRYTEEVSGVYTTLESGEIFLIDTRREKRSVFFELNKVNQNISYKKYDGSFVFLTNTDVSGITLKISNHIQRLYTKENELVSLIDSTNSISELKKIVIDQNTFKE